VGLEGVGVGVGLDAGLGGVTESNCSYMAAPMTDYLAFLWGFILVGYGFKYDNAVLTVLGASIVVEHVFQYMRKV
jgi:hypothetical protein